MSDLTGRFHGFGVELEEPGIAVIRLERPRTMNALTLTNKRELAEWLVHAQVDEGVRAVVITGTGNSFCAGDDVSGRPDTDSDEPVFVRPLNLGQRVPIRVHGALRVGSHPLARTMMAFDKPTLAAVNGFAIQSGLTLALACDFRIAARSAKLGSGTLRFAFEPDDGGHWLMVRRLGLPKALDFVMFNRIVAAEQALELGLVGEVVDDEVLLDHTLAMARTLADGPQVAMRLVKRALYGATELTFEQSLEDIASKTAVSDYHPDTTEGMAGFREHRPPVFNEWLLPRA